MDFLYMVVVVALWAVEFLAAKYVFDRFEEKKVERQKSGEQGRQTPEWLKQAIEGLIGVPLVIGLLALPFWVVSSLSNHAQDRLLDEQWANCENAKNADGEYLTKTQCEYFRDVLGGKYTDTTYYTRNFDE